MSLFGFGPSVDVFINVDGNEDRKTVEVKDFKDRKELCPVYYDGENVSGQVSS